MGLSSTQVSDDQIFDWSNTLPQTGGGEAEPPEEPQYTRQQKRPQKQETIKPPLKCPRCDSTNTKFCYYNNYNKSQPRHLCKTCKRHWTNGGTLRNVPIGSSRKNKRLKTTNANTRTTTSATTSIARPVNEFLPTSVSSFECNSLINLSSYDQSLSGYDNYKMDTMEGSTITTTIPNMNASSEFEIPNYWNWKEIDELTSTHDDLILDWYDTEIIEP